MEFYNILLQYSIKLENLLYFLDPWIKQHHFYKIICVCIKKGCHKVRKSQEKLKKKNVKSQKKSENLTN